MKFTITALVLTLLMSSSTSLYAHFPFLKIKRESQQSQVLQLFFAESLEPEDSSMLKYVEGITVKQVPQRGDPTSLDLKTVENTKAISLNESNAENLFVLQHDLGVRTKENQSYLVRYYSEAGPALSSFIWRSFKKQSIQDIKVIPSLENGKLTVDVYQQGKPVPKAEVNFYLVDGELPMISTNEQGQAEADVRNKLVQGLRVKVTEPVSGEIDGKKYTEIRHFITVNFPEVTWKDLEITQDYPDIPETVTSFGATADQQAIYYYGGHLGDAHAYDNEGHAHTLWKLELVKDSKWEKLAEGPGLQGLALVADQGKLYRLGGFTAKNKPGEDQDLWSQNNVACFDPATKAWTELPPLPEPRSSFDAVVDDHKIYVMGGWSLTGGKESAWLKTAYVMDLKQKELSWQPLPEPPFVKRALSLAAHNGKIYAIGGMQESGNVTTAVAVFDTKSQTWSTGPDLIGGGMTGFGTAAFTLDNKLYCSTFDGTLQTLSADGSQWELIGNFTHARFFHRMLPAGQHKLVMLGGSNMSIGKFENLETIHLKTK